MNDGRFERLRLGSWQVDTTSGKLSRGSDERFLRPKEMRLLVYLVQNQGRVIPVDELIANVWERSAASNDSLYYSISQIRAALDDLDVGPSMIRTIPKRGYQLREKAEFIAPDEASSVDPVAILRSLPGKFSSAVSGHRIVASVLGVSLLAVSILVLSTTTGNLRQETDAPDIKPAANSIAVMPFIDLSPGGDDTYFSEGISAEILNRLMRARGLRVVARTSSFALGSSQLDATSIGEALNVAFIVEGSVRREGSRVKIFIQLIDTSNGFQLWSKTYEQELRDVYVTQSEISTRIVDFLQATLQMKLHLQAVVPDQEMDPHTLDKYLMGLEALRVNSFDSLYLALEYFDAVLQSAPTFHEARTQLAEANLALLRTGASTETQLAIEAEALVKEVLRENPGDASARRVLASAYMWQLRRQEGVQELNRALTLAPNDSQVLVQSAAVKLSQGDVRRALRLAHRARMLDPVGAETLAVMGIAQSRLGQVKAASETFSKAIELNPGNPNLPWLLGMLQVEHQGEVAAGLSNFLRATSINSSDPEAAAYVAITFSSLDMPEEARLWVELAARSQPDSPTTMAAEAVYLSLIGQHKRAAEVAITALRGRSIRFSRNGMLTKSLLTIAASYLIESGNAAEAIRLFEEQSPFESEAFLGRFDEMRLRDFVGAGNILARRWMITLAAAYKAGGNSQEADEAIRQLEIARIGSIDRYREQYRNDDYLIEAEALTLEGDLDGALDMLEHAVKSNLLFNWQVDIDRNFAFADLRSEPRYALLLESIKNKIRKEREMVNRPFERVARSLDVH